MRWWWLVLWLGVSGVFAANAKLTLDLHHANLTDSVRLLAKHAGVNVIMSPKVDGWVSLHLQAVEPRQALDMLLNSQGLSRRVVGNNWWIAPHEESIKLQEEETKWQAAKEAAAPLQTAWWQIKYGKAEEIAKIFQDERSGFLSKRGRVRVDRRTNIICIQDLPQEIVVAGRLIAKLDVPVDQVLIEVRLVSVDSDYERELGINFAMGALSHSRTKLFAESVGRYSLAVAKLADGSLLDVKLAALENAGHARLISSPSLFTANQQPASIEAGEEIPYQEVSESGGTAVVFKKAVLGLKVTPQVLPGNNVLLRMQINQDRPSSKMVQGVPTINTRQIVSNALIKNGQTIVLGGIYETDEENGRQRIPFIGEVPWVGWLFTETHERKNKRQLLVFVTAKVIT